MSETIPVVLRRAAGTRGRRILLVVTVLVGVLAAAVLMAGLPPAERTFAAFAEPVHSFISVPLPFVGVLLAHDLRRSPGADHPARPRPATTAAAALPMLAGAILIAVAAGLVGDVLSAGALAAAGSTAQEPWADAGFLAFGGVLAQVLAQLVGTGLGLLIGRPVWACLATIAVPLTAYAILTPAGGVRAWLTPFGSLQEVFAGPGAAGWANWATAVLIWGVALNLAGVTLLRRKADMASVR